MVAMDIYFIGYHGYVVKRGLFTRKIEILKKSRNRSIKVILLQLIYNIF